jgi:hypothetical protein
LFLTTFDLFVIFEAAESEVVIGKAPKQKANLTKFSLSKYVIFVVAPLRFGKKWLVRRSLHFTLIEWVMATTKIPCPTSGEPDMFCFRT